MPRKLAMWSAPGEGLLARVVTCDTVWSGGHHVKCSSVQCSACGSLILCHQPGAFPRLPNGRPRNGQLLYEAREYADPCQIETVAMPTATGSDGDPCSSWWRHAHFRMKSKTFNYKNQEGIQHNDRAWPTRWSWLLFSAPLLLLVDICNAPQLQRTRLIFCAGCFLHSGHSQSPTGSSLIPTHSQWNH